MKGKALILTRETFSFQNRRLRRLELATQQCLDHKSIVQNSRSHDVEGEVVLQNERSHRKTLLLLVFRNKSF